jgi:hypothetical protein
MKIFSQISPTLSNARCSFPQPGETYELFPIIVNSVMRKMNMTRIIQLCASATLMNFSSAWVNVGNPSTAIRSNAIRPTSKLNFMIPEAATSVLAGSIAGAAGVGIAFPLDTLKTKQQLEVEQCSRVEYEFSPTGEISIIRGPSSSLWTTLTEILKTEGLAGFYGGVRTSMAGQALIKATAFSVNTAALHADYNIAAAAATAGLVTAFLAVPVDRIKVLMQSGCYDTEYECFERVLESEGYKGLLTTGLMPTLFREVPAYTLYFYLYGMLMASSTMGSEGLGQLAPLVSGALAGACCVVPVHPVDVVKTIVQHSAADWQEVVSEIYEGRGFEGFWEGLTPRMSRAAINHSATFAVYEFIMHTLL